MNHSLEKLLVGFIDYAGLFPPAGLTMNDAVTEFAAHLRREHAWILSRFVVPAGRLPELGTCISDLEAGPQWSLSVLVTVADLETGADHIKTFESEHGDFVKVSSIEVAVHNAGHIAAVTARFAHLQRYFEIDARVDPGPLMEVISRRGGAAKIRTGGIVEEAFPNAAELARFVARANRYGVPFKATAGLHHPFPGRYPLTYDVDAAVGAMHGFLDLMVGAALVRSGSLDEEGLAAVLAGYHDAPRLSADADGVTWQGYHVSCEHLDQARKEFFHAIGSCSIVEPVEGLLAANLWPRARPEGQSAATPGDP